MMTEKPGFEEIAHTADWALRVWSTDIASLFSRAAAGMYWLMETSLQSSPRVNRTLRLSGEDIETLLVMFLSELLYISESEGLGFDTFSLWIENNSLRADLTGAPVRELRKEIKAVTFHNLKVTFDNGRYEVVIVFDV